MTRKVLLMRKLSALLSLTLLVGSLATSQANAADPAAGTKCSKAGTTSILYGVKFTCIKSGKKLVWNKGVFQVSKTTTASTPTPSNSTAPMAPKAAFKAPIPIKLPVAQTGTITFANIMDHISEIPITAWQSVQDAIATNPPVASITNAVHVGPNTQLDVVGGLPRIQDILLRDQKLWSGFTQVSTFNLLMYNAQDEPWAEEDWKKTAQEKHYFQNVISSEVTRIAGNCQKTLSPGVFSGPPTSCGGADSTAITNSDEAILTFSQRGQVSANDPFIAGGGIVGHEYIHSVQAGQWIGKPSSYCTEQTQDQKCFRSWDSNWGFSPCWLFEGLPNSAGPMTSSETLPAYQDYRKNLPYGQGPTTVTDYSQSSLRDYLFNQVSSTCYSNGSLYRLGYTVGALATEALIAIDGPQAAMALYALGADGQDFPTAFQNVYGISWSDASTILSKVLAAEYATFGSPPQ